MPDKIRIVHVGCGGISGAWLQHPFIKERVDIVAFIDLDVEAARQCAIKYGFEEAEAGTNLDEMLKKHKPAAVFDCTIPAAHRDVTVTALEHGCHVLGEKPMSDSLESAREMVNAAQKSGCTYAVTQTRRYDNNLRRFVEFLKSGAIGDIQTVQSEFFIGAHFDGFRAEMQHVLILDMAIHTFDAARLIAGVNPQSVICEDWNPPSSWYKHGASAMALFRMDKGIRYLYHGSWCSEGLNTSWECRWHVIGSKGSASWAGNEDITAEIVDENDDGFIKKPISIQIPPYSNSQAETSHAGVISEFLDCLENGGTPETVCTDNIHSLAMVIAAMESAEKDGSRVSITL